MDMSVNSKIDNNLGARGQKVKDQTGNSSSLSLTKNGNVGIGTTSPKHRLDVSGTLRIKSNKVGEGIFFAETKYVLGDFSQQLRLQREVGGVVLRIFEIALSDPNEKGSFFCKLPRQGDILKGEVLAS
jgi:hypothetical protein